MTAATTDGLSALQAPRHARWEPRRAMHLSVARRRSAFVRGLRVALLALAAALAGWIVVQLALGAIPRGEAEAEIVSEDVRMTNPRFTGRDAAGAPFVVTADYAVRRRGDAAHLTELENPRLDYDMLETAAGVEGMLADSGLYDSLDRTLDLRANVNFRTRTGYVFVTENARLHLRDNRVEGTSPVMGEGPMGAISANSFEVRDGGDHVIFEGDVRTRIYNRRGETGGAQHDTPEGEN